MLLLLVMLIFSAVGTTYCYLVTKTDPVTNVFVPGPADEPCPALTVQIGIDKVVHNVGKATHWKGGFQFVLENLTTSQGLRATSDNNGKASFLLSYTQADAGKTYTYRLFEADLGLAGMTYDTSVYEIAIEVSLNESNALVAALTMDGESVDALQARFENTYDADTPVAPPTGDSAKLTLWFVGMSVSGSALVALAVYDRKRSGI